ncbi:hypothetical protein SEPCBS119000_000633 [Sporothrix epigloea]|uniref:BZIP transcription factor n=1 Tax=Sporothrix epigloea TaxID=1892477 RepID=A0ABP0D693_9PEZI
MTASAPEYQRRATGDAENMDADLQMRPVKTDGRTSTRASSRAAANLSMERLYRKRAIDRENQRVLRQKNKARLVELEAEVRSLSEQLARVEADRATAAERTLTSSSTLDTIISSLQSLQVSLASVAASSSAGSEGRRTPESLSSARQGTASISPPAAFAQGFAYEDRPMTGTEQPSTRSYQQAHYGDPSTRNRERLDVLSVHALPTAQDDSPQQEDVLSREVDLLTQSLPLFARDAPSQMHDDYKQVRFPVRPSSVAIPSHTPSPKQLHSQPYPSSQTQLQPLRPLRPSRHPTDKPDHDVHDESKSAPRSPPGHIKMQASPPAVVGEGWHDDPAVAYMARVEANQLRDKSPIWAATPAYVPPTTNVDRLTLHILQRQKTHHNGKRQNSNTVPEPTAAASSPFVTAAAASAAASPAAPSHLDDSTHAHFPSVISLLNPVLREPHEPQLPAVSISADHVTGPLTVFTTPEKLALLYVTRIYTRWLIAPTRQHYDSIPEFFRPTASQLIVPHPVWIDTLGWPRARERLINHFDYTRYPEFASIISESFSISWPHDALEGILEDGAGGGDIMTRAFVQHVREPRNWTVGPELVEAFPILDGAVNVRGRLPVSL